MTGGVAACDYNDSGRISFFLTRVGLPNELFRNDGNGRFTNVAAQAGVLGPDPKQGYAAVVCGDLNGDGRMDFFLTGAGDDGNVLYMNNGNGTFTDDTAAAGLSSPPEPAGYSDAMYGAALDDYDHSGRLSLVVLQWNTSLIDPYGSTTNSSNALSLLGNASANPEGVCSATQNLEDQFSSENLPPVSPTRSALFHNDGNGPGDIPHFTNVTSSVGLDFNDLLGFNPMFVDLNGDGWDDLVVTGDSCTTQVWMNEDGKRFVNVTQQSGLGTAENGMGIAAADLTGDGLPDIFETGIYYPTSGNVCPSTQILVGCSGDRLYVNDGDGTFRDATDSYGVRDGLWGWGAAAVDFANTGRLSLVEVNGYSDPANSFMNQGDFEYSFDRHFVQGSVQLWFNAGSTPLPEVAHDVGLDSRGEGKAVVPVDFLNDGRVGLFITNTGEDPVLYRNDTRNDNGWITIRLHNPRSENDYGVGAEVRVWTTSNGPMQSAELMDGGSFESSDPLELHFGFGPGISTIDRIEVLWPGESTPQVLQHVEADRIITIDHP